MRWTSASRQEDIASPGEPISVTRVCTSPGSRARPASGRSGRSSWCGSATVAPESVETSRDDECDVVGGALLTLEGSNRLRDLGRDLPTRTAIRADQRCDQAIVAPLIAGRIGAFGHPIGVERDQVARLERCLALLVVRGRHDAEDGAALLEQLVRAVL